MKKRLVSFVGVVFFVFCFSSIPSAAQFSSWQKISQSVNSGSLMSIAYGNGIFVILGALVDNIYSLDRGLTWKRIDDHNLTGSPLALAYGNGRFVMDSSWSADGVNWHRADSEPGITAFSTVITYGNGLFVSGYYNGEIWTSPDGNVWTQRNSGLTATDWILNAAYANGKFVAAAWAAPSTDMTSWFTKILTSTDGINWKIQSNHLLPSPAGLTFGNGQFVITAGQSILVSTDGENWTYKTANEFLGEITYGEGQFVSTSFSDIFISSDAVSWTKAVNDAKWLHGLTYGDGTFIAVGDNGEIFRSEDCAATLSSSDYKLHIPEISFGGSYYTVDMEYVSTSDGLIWFKLTNAASTQNTCSSPATLTSSGGTYTLHTPYLTYGSVSYWADFEYAPTTDGLIWFKLTNAGQN